MPNAEVFSVAPGEKPDTLLVTSIGSPELKRTYASLTPVSAHGKTLLFAYEKGQTNFDVYEVTGASPYLKPTESKPPIKKPVDIANGFILGNTPYICTYTAENGIFEIYSVENDSSLSTPYEFYRNHELAISHGFTTVKIFNQFGQVVVLGYRSDTGYVAIYTVGVIVSSPTAGQPPLQMLPVWAHPWAPGWTRFAFFTFGGEPFFLKTNTKQLNVNIDHILDTLGSGTVEVGTGKAMQEQLPNALAITNVEPFILANGQPYFVTFISKSDDAGLSGKATLNRIHADCLGWTQVSEFDAPVGSTVLTPVAIGGQVYLVFS
jgi:hypothetical protein